MSKFQFFYLGLILIVNLNFITTNQVYMTGHPFSDHDNDDDVHSLDNKVQERMTLIFPGTKWCGPGDIAKHYDDLGYFRETDMCCRAHDHCENIEAGEEKHGLKNDDWFTILHCDCDRQFFHCLKATNHTVSNFVGNQYFMMRSKCYKEEHPIVECVEEQKLVFIKRCIKYRYTTAQPKLYQWFDLPLYDIEFYPDMIDNKIEIIEN